MAIKWGGGGATGAAYGGRNGQDLVSWFTQKFEAVAEGNSDLMSEAVSMGEARMKERILTDERLNNGKRGRVETGKMVSAVSSRFTLSKKGNAAGAFGWINGGEDYFKYQEGGFEHVGSGMDVEGMYALRDAKDEAWEWFKSESKKRNK